MQTPSAQTPDPNGSEDLARLDALLEIVCESDPATRDDQMLAELNALLRRSPACRQAYVEYASIHADLFNPSCWVDDSVLDSVVSDAMDARRVRELQGLAMTPVDTKEPSGTGRLWETAQVLGQLVRQMPRSQKLAVFSVAAGLMLAFILLPVLLLSSASQSSPEDNRFASVPSTALLVESVGAVWRDGGPRDDTLSPETDYVLRDGLVKIAFESEGGQDTVIVQGPARFRVSDARGLALHEGRLSAVAHPGFVVNAGRTQIVDLGTSFGVQVDRLGAVQAHVFKGSVRVAFADQPSKQLAEGESVAVNRVGDMQEQASQPASFVQEEEFEVRQLAAAGSAYHRWLASSYDFQQDPDTIAYYLFDDLQRSPGVLENRASATRGRWQGRLGFAGMPNSSPEVGQGRWSGHDALRFTAAEQDVVRIAERDAKALNGRETLTIAAWVRPQDRSILSHHLVTRRLPGRDNINLVLIWNPPGGEFDPNYRPATLLFNTVSTGLDYLQHQGAAGVLPNPEQPVWMHVAVTFDRGARRFYVNGEMVEYKPKANQNAIDELDAELLIGGSAMQIGKPYTFFDGEMDELLILGRAMDADQIRQAYEAGRPAQTE